MKKYLFIMFTCLLGWGNVMADNIIINDVTIPQGGMAELAVGYIFTSEDAKVGFTLPFIFPKGIKFATDGDGEPLYVQGEAIKKFSITFVGNNIQAFPSSENSTIKGTGGTLLTLYISAAAELEVGSTYEVLVKAPLFQVKQDGKTEDMKLNDYSFKVTIGDPLDSRTVLDETSTVMPEAATSVDVRVRRTLTADVWNTIVLPFSMTSQQMEEAFGDGVQLADFTGCEATYDNEDDEYASAIKVNFSDVSAIEANHPYIIKVKEPISEFTVDGVDINPEEDLSVNRDEYRTGSGTKKDPYVYHYNSFVGTYMANTDVPKQTIFLNGNKFWYSTGLTKMRAYRAYFDFYDVLADVEGAESKISFVVDGEATDIMGISAPRYVEGDVYNVQGLHVGKDVDMNRLPKGIYIVNGKKYSVK
ncbi:MAG: hypothetical protein IJK87_12425 [Prevotella sp.]|nr:hypothetical protein [Prevotella sp.]